MKNLCLLFALFLSFNAFGQNSKFRLGINIKPGVTGNFLSNDGTVPKSVSDTYKQSEKRTFGYSGHLFAEYGIRARWKMQIGIGYLRTGFTESKLGLIFEVPEPSQPVSFHFEWAYHDIILPLHLRYNFSKNKNTFYLLAGLSPIIKLKHAKIITTQYADGSQIRKKEADKGTTYRDYNLNASAAIGYNLKIGKKTSIYFQPGFDCTTFGVAKSASLNRRIYMIGMSAGLIFG